MKGVREKRKKISQPAITCICALYSSCGFRALLGLVDIFYNTFSIAISGQLFSRFSSTPPDSNFPAEAFRKVGLESEEKSSAILYTTTRVNMLKTSTSILCTE